MRPIGVKNPYKMFIGGKRVNQGLKFGAKALGYLGDMAVPSSFIAPQITPILEAAKVGSVTLGALQEGRQFIKHM
jgi:hypothetical protein